MPFPAIFYYDSENTESVYQYNKGEMVVEKLIRNKPYRRIDKRGLQKAKKTLIFTDWTTFKYRKGSNEKQVAEVLVVINQLLSDGFKIYCLYLSPAFSTTFIPLTKSILPILSNLACVELSVTEDSELIKWFCEEYNMPKSKIHILDYYWLQTMINKNEKNEPRALKLEYALDGQPERIISAQKKSTPPLEKI